MSHHENVSVSQEEIDRTARINMEACVEILITTAVLDPIAEAQVYSDFSNMVDNKTAIYISHRLSSCQFCDKITVFDKGRIVQKGPHAELLSETEGKYCEL